MSLPPNRYLGIALPQGVRPLNLNAYFFVALVSSGFAGLLAVLEPGLWQLMDIPKEQQSLYTSGLRVLQEFFYITLMGIFGALSDTRGRRIIYALGLIAISLGIAAYPFATNITELIIFRSLIGIGGAAMMAMMVAVIADYTLDDTRGRANGIQGFMVTLGALVPVIMGFLPKVFANQGLEALPAYQATFMVSGALGLIAAITAGVGLAKVLPAKITTAKESIGASLRLGLAAAKKDSRIALSYGAAFISRGDLAVTGAFMGLWIGQVARYDLGLDTGEATIMITTRVFTTVGGALIGSLLLGFVFDRIGRVTAVTLAAGLASVVYLTMGFVTDPTSDWVLGLLFFMGIAELSAFVSSQALVGQYAPAERRGAVIGFFGVAGAIGILIGSGGGGAVYYKFGPGSPFILFGILNFIVFLWSLKVRKQQPDS